MTVGKRAHCRPAVSEAKCRPLVAVRLHGKSPLLRGSIGEEPSFKRRSAALDGAGMYYDVGPSVARAWPKSLETSAMLP